MSDLTVTTSVLESRWILKQFEKAINCACIQFKIVSEAEKRKSQTSSILSLATLKYHPLVKIPPSQACWQ